VVNRAEVTGHVTGTKRLLQTHQKVASLWKVPLTWDRNKHDSIVRLVVQLVATHNGANITKEVGQR
jgi:hypothetical protein